MRIQFFGGTGTVTGSKYLLEHEGRRLLVDCGLFQGVKQLRLRNWHPLPTNAADIDAVLLTHAHIDHSGFVPRLVNLGFKGGEGCVGGGPAPPRNPLPRACVRGPDDLEPSRAGARGRP